MCDDDLWNKVKKTIIPIKSNVNINKDKKNVSQIIHKQKIYSNIQYTNFVYNSSEQKNKELIHGDFYKTDANVEKKIKNIVKVNERLDLHGLNYDEAQEKVIHFIVNSYENKKRYVLIITGKGKKILQNAVPDWLNNNRIKPFILAFDFANKKNGGKGAVIVYIKNKFKYKK